MPKASVLIAGCGDIGSRLATQLLDKGWQVYGLRRSIERLPAGVKGIVGDLFSEQCPAQWPTGQIDYVVYSAAATDHDEAGYQAAYVDGLKHTLAWLKQNGQQPKRLLFVSSRLCRRAEGHRGQALRPGAPAPERHPDRAAQPCRRARAAARRR